MKQAKNSVEAGYIPTVLERMAQSYINVGSLTENADDYAQAIECFKEIVDLGWDTYITHNNMGVLYERMGSYSEANRVYIQMLSKYGEDYRTYKRLAFLEAHIQSTKANRERDYAQFVIYYDKAKELFEESNAKADSDMEMQLLNQAYQQLVDGNWIETE